MERDPRATIDRLDRFLEACDPVGRSTLTTGSVEGVLDDIGALIVSGSPTARPAARRRSIGRPRTAILLAAAVLATSAAVGAGAVWTAHTGHFPTKAEEQMGGPGEALDPAAPDYREVALQVASDIPYPAGYESWRDLLISDEIRSADGGVESTGALHGWFAAIAYCAWVHTWRQADIAGDTAAARRAAQVISQAPSWTAVTDEDPHPDPSVPADQGSTYTLFGWMLPYRDAVLAGDRPRVEQLLAAGYGDKCWTSDPDWRAQLAAHPEWAILSRNEMAQKYEQFLASARS
jgi:hypothetical protein